MKAVEVNVVSYTKEGCRVVDATIVADTTPSPLPTTGYGVDGLLPTDIYAPFSFLYIVGDAPVKLYITNESGVFQPQ